MLRSGSTRRPQRYRGELWPIIESRAERLESKCFISRKARFSVVALSSFSNSPNDSHHYAPRARFDRLRFSCQPQRPFAETTTSSLVRRFRLLSIRLLTSSQGKETRRRSDPISAPLRNHRHCCSRSASRQSRQHSRRCRRSSTRHEPHTVVFERWSLRQRVRSHESRRLLVRTFPLSLMRSSYWLIYASQCQRTPLSR